MSPENELPILLLMVKNEEEGIERPIRSAAALGIREVIVVDTGSTDGTLRRATEIAEELELGFSTEYVTWSGSFADARNLALDWASLYPNEGRHVLFLDADDEVTGRWHPPPVAEAVGTVQMRMGSDSWTMPRAIPLADPRPRYHGAVHEQLHTGARLLFDTGLTVRHHAGKPSTARWQRDEIVLWEEWSKTKAPRALFYLAQTIECLAGDDRTRQQLAAHLYDTRACLDASEEAFVALVRAAGIHARFPGRHDTPESILEERLRAHERFPDRPEPLVDAAWAFLRAERWASAYAFAKMAQGCTPREDALFLRRTAQWNETYDILSRACLHVPGKLEEGLRITRTAAKHLAPGVAAFDWPRKNLAVYRERLGIAEPFPEEDAAFVGGPPALELDDRVVPGRRDHRKGDAIVGGCHREAVAVGARGATNGEECAVSFDEQRRPLRRLPLIAKHCERIAPADRQRAAVPIKGLVIDRRLRKRHVHHRRRRGRRDKAHVIRRRSRVARRRVHDGCHR